MISRLLSGHWLHQVWFNLFFKFALATLQNVTVDDSVLTGSTAPVYLPSPTNWNQGNLCTGCYVQPDPSMAYNGTWHDSTFIPTSSVDQEFTFTFVGSAVYVFFILANTVPNATTTTNVTFTLDGVHVSTFNHAPTTSTDYEYNQAVYANDSIPFGQHTMLVAPVNDSVDHTLILFDYYIYTTDESDVTVTTTTTTTTTSGSIPTTASGSVPTTVLSSPSLVASSAPIASATSSNIDAIVGGVVGGLGAIALVTVCFLCYRRHKRRTAGPSSQVQWVSEAPFVRTSQALPEIIQPELRRKGNVPASLPTTVPSSSSAVATQSSADAANGTTELLGQVERLRAEVVLMRRMQNQWPGIVADPPPMYSRG